MDVLSLLCQTKPDIVLRIFGYGKKRSNDGRRLPVEGDSDLLTYRIAEQPTLSVTEDAVVETRYKTLTHCRDRESLNSASTDVHIIEDSCNEHQIKYVKCNRSETCDNDLSNFNINRKSPVQSKKCRDNQTSQNVAFTQDTEIIQTLTNIEANRVETLIDRMDDANHGIHCNSEQTPDNVAKNNIGKKSLNLSEMNLNIHGSHVRNQNGGTTQEMCMTAAPSVNPQIHRDLVQDKDLFVDQDTKTEQISEVEHPIKNTKVTNFQCNSETKLNDCETINVDNRVKNSKTDRNLGAITRNTVSCSNGNIIEDSLVENFCKPITETGDESKTETTVEINRNDNFINVIDSNYQCKGKPRNTTYQDVIAWNRNSRSNDESTMEEPIMNYIDIVKYNSDIKRTLNFHGDADGETITKENKINDSDLQNDNMKNKAPFCIFKLPESIKVYEGEPAMFNCKITGQPKPMVRWLHQGDEIKNDGEYIVDESDGGNCLMIISRADFHHSGIYICIAENIGGSVQTSCLLTVNKGETSSNMDYEEEQQDVKSDNQTYNTPVFECTPEDVYVLQGEQATITCKVLNKPLPLITWLRDHDVIANSGRFQTYTKLDGTCCLDIDDVDYDDIGKYECLAVNSEGVKKVSIYLDIAESPQVNQSLKSLEVDQGQTAQLKCQIDGIPEPTVVWRKDGSLITASHRYRLSVTKEDVYSLKIYNFEIDDAGEYSVHAENMAGEITSTAVVKLKETMINDFAIKKTDLEDTYKVFEELGRGAFGITKRCMSYASNKHFAAKFIRVRNGNKEDIYREIRIMSCLDHQRLIKLYDAYETKIEVVMVMEIVTGGELFERIIDEETLTEDKAAFFIRQVLEGLQYMHKKGVVHLDLKPENILLESEERDDVKLIDFGLARKLIPGEDVTCKKGTPEFVAPEMVKQQPVTTGSDIWSVGVIAYILLSGLSPFLGETDRETLLKVKCGEWDFEDEVWDEISDDAKDFIAKLLNKEPSARLGTNECLQHKWLKVEEMKYAEKEKARLSTARLKSFNSRRKWQRALTAVKSAVRICRLSSLTGLKNSSRAGSRITCTNSVTPKDSQKLVSTTDSTMRAGNVEEKIQNLERRISETSIEDCTSNNKGTEEYDTACFRMNSSDWALKDTCLQNSNLQPINKDNITDNKKACNCRFELTNHNFTVTNESCMETEEDYTTCVSQTVQKDPTCSLHTTIIKDNTTSTLDTETVRDTNCISQLDTETEDTNCVSQIIKTKLHATIKDDSTTNTTDTAKDTHCMSQLDKETEETNVDSTNNCNRSSNLCTSLECTDLLQHEPFTKNSEPNAVVINASDNHGRKLSMKLESSRTVSAVTIESPAVGSTVLSDSETDCDTVTTLVGFFSEHLSDSLTEALPNSASDLQYGSMNGEKLESQFSYIDSNGNRGSKSNKQNNDFTSLTNARRRRLVKSVTIDQPSIESQEKQISSTTRRRIYSENDEPQPDSQESVDSVFSDSIEYTSREISSSSSESTVPRRHPSTQRTSTLFSISENEDNRENGKHVDATYNPPSPTKTLIKRRSTYQTWSQESQDSIDIPVSEESEKTEDFFSKLNTDIMAADAGRQSKSKKRRTGFAFQPGQDSIPANAFLNTSEEESPKMLSVATVMMKLHMNRQSSRNQSTSDEPDKPISKSSESNGKKVTLTGTRDLSPEDVEAKLDFLTTFKDENLDFPILYKLWLLRKNEYANIVIGCIFGIFLALLLKFMFSTIIDIFRS